MLLGTRWAARLFGAELAISLVSCGRIGVELTPRDNGTPTPPIDAGPADASDVGDGATGDAAQDSGPSASFDGSLVSDAAPPDSSFGSDASPVSDAATADASCGATCATDAGPAACDGGTCPAVCNLRGTFAIKLSQQTSWPSNANIRAGSGAHAFWLRMNATQNGTTVSASLTECGRSIPEFRASAVNETFDFDLPLSVFDASYLPSTGSTISLSSSTPGAALSMPSAAFLIGTTLSDPINAAWPSATALSPVDMDADGKPGVTMSYLAGGSYVAPRVGPTVFDERAERPYSATRLVFSLGGALTSCTQASGPAVVSHIDTAIFGCKIAGDARDCSGSEASFLDQNCLDYAVGTSTYNMVKVVDAASCAAVRAALP